MATNLHLSISTAAKKKIELLVDEFKGRFGNREITVVPAILWVDSRLNNERFQSQPAIGFYDNRGEIENDILVIDGFEVVREVDPDFGTRGLIGTRAAPS